MSKILIIGINYYPELTGIGKYTAEFASFIANNKGCEVDVITGNPYYPKWKVFDGYKNKWFTKEVLNKVNIYRAPLYVPSAPSGMKRQLQDSLFFSATLLLTTYFLIFHKKKYTHIFIAVPSFILGLTGLYYRFFRKKTVVIYHIQDLQIDAAEQLGMLKKEKLIKLFYSIEKYIINKVNYVSTISEGMQKKVLEKSNQIKECIIFSNWTNNTNIYRITPKPVVHYQGLEGKKIIFYSGAIGEKQGLEIVLETALMLKENSNLAFVISGEGPYKTKLMGLAEQMGITNVYFFNLLPIDQFNELLNASFIHLVIQKEEAGDLVLPSKLTNILGVGGCAIITASPGTSLHGIISKADCGYLIPPMNVEALAKAITLFLSKEELYSKISNNALLYACNYLNINNVITTFTTNVGITAD